MARTRNGQVVQRTWKSGRGFALRFIAYGQRRYVTLGTEHDGWTRRKAEDELQNILADVRRGIWTPPTRRRDIPASSDPADEGVTFHRFASNRLAARKGEVAARTYEFDAWALQQHLLPYFATWPLASIDIQAVDDYRRHKVQQAELRRTAIERGEPLRDEDGRSLRPLASQTINRTIDVLQSILALAVEYQHLPNNPVAGRRRRLKAPAKRPVYLDNVHQIQALLDAAAELDAEPVWRIDGRRAAIATLVLAGPRAHELCLLRWRDVDLDHRRIRIERSKTDAGIREIQLFPLLREELAAHKARLRSTGPNDPVFPTTNGRERDVDNLRKRILAPAVERADKLLEARGQTPLPVGVTPHKLRHTFASILVACGEDPASLMAQLGHTDPKFTLRVYTHLMRRDPAERAQLKALVNCGPAALSEAAAPAGAHLFAA